MDILDYVSHPNFLSFHSNRNKTYVSIWMQGDYAEDGKWKALDGKLLSYNIYIVNIPK